MIDATDESASTPPMEDFALFGGLVLVAMIVALAFALRSILSLRPRVIP